MYKGESGRGLAENLLQAQLRCYNTFNWHVELHLSIFRIGKISKIHIVKFYKGRKTITKQYNPFLFY